jgi:phosphoserine phosphatase RsbU/P
MGPIALFSVLLMIASSPTAMAAVSGSWTTLDGTWRWHAGDNPQWATATLDDSHWSPLPVPGPLPPARQYWMRRQVQTEEMSNPGLLLGPITYAYDVYWDGQPIGRFGDLARGQWFTPRWQTFRLPSSLTRPGTPTIALRIGQIGVTFGTRGPRLGAGENRIGDFATLHEAESAYRRAEFQPQLLQLLVDFGLVLAGFYFLLLPSFISPGATFRWLGVTLLSRAVFVLYTFYANYGPLHLPGSVLRALGPVVTALCFIAPIEFAYALFRRPVPIAVRCLEALLAIGVITPVLSVPVTFVKLTIRFIAVMVPIVLAGFEFRKRTVDAGLTFLLFVIWGGTVLESVFVWATTDLVRPVVSVIGHVILPPDFIYVAGFRLWIWDLALLVWVPAIAMQIHKANLRFRDEREWLRRELEAARQVQELLLPSQSIQIPGFEIDARYHPANEVGGDFFQLFPAPQNEFLVVVVDVSGKGMRAALLVSVIVGVLQNRRSDAPAALLHELNTVLLGRSEGSFTTCCCARFASDGTVTLANAGHVTPYRNGEEIMTPPGLPLGLTAEAEWEEVQIQLQPGDRLLWISDGVIEARNSQRELLGFERAQELAAQSASEIARAAQEFGQEDDITVLSITRQKASLGVAAV